MDRVVLTGQMRRSSILTQTRMGWDIPNTQSFDSGLTDQCQLEDQKLKYKKAEFRTGLIPIFNCHGLTFAARRTAISDTSAVRRILKEDCYTRISPDQVQPGDIILYTSSTDGDLEHSGVVIALPDERPLVPKILSKWGFGAEVLHWANDCPYDFSQAAYYRIRR
ncbi:MAG: hypothetical protein JXP34_26735 [Planctomycetes bacterium]|nr:hypothetical protein [Planctomycetota bacterium]